MSAYFRLAVTCALFWVARCSSSQTVFASDSGPIDYYSSSYNETVPKLHLSSLGSSQDFTTLSHPSFPFHSVRIKKSDFCDPTVQVYTGYLDVNQGAKHIFFYFFESRNDPDNDDLLMWINGGPGCSSSLGLLMENGPCSIDMNNTSLNGTVWNPYGWNANTNVFFVDQPVGVGFSYADYGLAVETTEDASKDIYSFISIFLETFPQFTGRPLHLSGESYGGRYLPVFASTIVDENDLAAKEGRAQINLQSVLIGNGITDISTLYPGRFEIGCGKAAFDQPFLSIKDCVNMKTALPRCQTGLRDNCIDKFDAIGCKAAAAFCEAEITAPMSATGRNVYDVSKMCGDNDLCYAENDVISKFLNNETTRSILGVPSHLNLTYSACSDPVYEGFNAHLDKWSVPNQYYVAGLLERGIRMLIYAGTWDWQCNWVANKQWVDKLEWSGKATWDTASWRKWIVDDKEVGEVKEIDGLTFATVWEAGHMMSFSFFYCMLA